MPATTRDEAALTGQRQPIETRRPPLVRSLPLIGPLRQFLGDVHPFLSETRATYGDAFRLRMLNVEMTCLFGEEAIDLLEAGSCLRTSKSMHVLDGALDSCLASTFDGPQHQMVRIAHLQFMNAHLEDKRRVDTSSVRDDQLVVWLA